MVGGYRALLAAILALALLPLQGTADLVDEFLRTYKRLNEVADVSGINRLAAKDQRLTEEVLQHYALKFAGDGDLATIAEIDPLIAAADQAEQGTRYRKRFDLMKGYTAEQRKAWLEVWKAWSAAADVFVEANTKKDNSGLRRAMGEISDVVDQAVKLKDLETASYARYHVGYCHEILGEYLEVVTAFDKAMDEWVQSGRPKSSQFYQHMVDKRRELLEKGFNPFEKGGPAPAPGEKGPKPQGPTAYKAGSDWQEWPTEFREMKDPAQIPSISPWGCDNVLLWREFNWSDKNSKTDKEQGSHDLGSLVKAAPFGKPMKILRDGAKGWFDLDDNGKESKADAPCKIIDGRPTLNTIRSGEGKDADAWSVFMLSGGQTQWFESAVNWTELGRYRIGCYREAKILGETVLFVDDNCTGVLGDPSELRDNILHGGPSWIDDDGVVIGKGRPQPWSDVMQVAGKWCHFKIADPFARKVRTRELDITTGQVVLKWNGPVAPKVLVLAEVKDFKGSFFDVAGGKPVVVPAGRYAIAYGRIENGKAGQLKQAWIFKGASEEIEVKAGETATLDMGAPYKFDVESKDQGKSQLVEGKTLIVREKSGAIVGRIYDEIPFPEIAARQKGGAPFGKPRTMAKIPTELFNKDPVAQWFPADVVIEKPERTLLEVQLTLKKHALLGGPFTSDWK